jgi:hypothetical protein
MPEDHEPDAPERDSGTKGSPTPVSSAVSGPVELVAGLIAPDRNPAGAVYGTITIGVLLAAEASKAETYVKTVVAICVTLMLYWLAHGYAHVVGLRLSHQRRWTIGSIARALFHELAILRGGLIPLLAVIGAWMANAKLSQGINAGLWTSAAVLVLVELIAGVRSRLRPAELTLQTSFGAIFGIAIIGLRALLH